MMAQFAATREEKRREIRIEAAERCPECRTGRPTRDHMRGESICDTCGLVLDDYVVEQGPEWRTFQDGQGEARVRTGPPSTPMLHDRGLTTEISWGDRDSHGQRISSRSRAQLQRMRKWQRRIRVHNALERSMVKALADIDNLASRMGLPRDVREGAAMLYRRGVERHLVRGRSVEEVVGAAVYAACRQRGVPRTLDEIATAALVGRKALGRTYRLMARDLHLRLQLTRPQDYVSRFVSDMKLSMDVQAKTLELLDEAHQRELLSGRGPTGMAAAALYIATVVCNERRTQREVADIAGVTEVTIRNRYKELCDRLGLLVAL